MKPVLIFATNNAGKVKEVRSLLPQGTRILTLREAGILVDIPEPYDSLEENAREKSTVIYQRTGQDCFSEDTGLEVESLDSAPGVRSARYAGNDSNSENNIDLLLKNMEGSVNRAAQFRTVLSLIIGGQEVQFEGICTGTITRNRMGEGGFGYDAVFIPDGSEKTFAQMTLEEKNKFSHRKKATQKFISYLNDLYGKD